jgi:16S rRNA (uracil1498-N3)-methyltransferase
VHITRLFIDDDLEVGRDIELPDKSAHHVLHVLRKGVNDELILFNGQGGEYHASITHIKRSHVEVSIHSKDTIDRESTLQITLGLGILKRDAMNTTLQKATELGVSKIVPVETANTSVQRKQLEKRETQWRHVIQSACEQSGRTQIPHLDFVHKFDDFLAIDNHDLKLIPSPTSEVPMSSIDSVVKSICVVIGPEGGFSDAEMTLAIENDFHPVSIGKRILRAETVPSVILTLLQDRWGDF